MAVSSRFSLTGRALPCIDLRMNSRKPLPKLPVPVLRPGQCGACGWMHGPDIECPLQDLGYAKGFEPPSLKGQVKRDKDVWAAYMRDRRAKQKAKRVAAASAAAAATPEPAPKPEIADEEPWSGHDGDDDDTVH